jgi:hypothetical protein
MPHPTSSAQFGHIIPQTCEDFLIAFQPYLLKCFATRAISASLENDHIRVAHNFQHRRCVSRENSLKAREIKSLLTERTLIEARTSNARGRYHCNRIKPATRTIQTKRAPRVNNRYLCMIPLIDRRWNGHTIRLRPWLLVVKSDR